jgi:hypothetical protein
MATFPLGRRRTGYAHPHDASRDALTRTTVALVEPEIL